MDKVEVLRRRSPWYRLCIFQERRGAKKRKTGLAITTIRVLPKVIRCYRCHEIGHMANKYLISPGKTKCRKCGAMGHTIANCGNAPKCTLCSKDSEIRLSHVMGSLACPMYGKLIYDIKLAQPGSVESTWCLYRNRIDNFPSGIMIRRGMRLFG
jgi:hypothetical protein